MITKHLSRNAGGKVVLAVRVTGADDVYRFARSLQTLDGEPARKGTLVLHGLRRLVGKPRYEALAYAHFADRAAA